MIHRDSPARATLGDITVIGIVKCVHHFDKLGGTGIAFFWARQGLAKILLADGGCDRIPSSAAATQVIECSDLAGEIVRVVKRGGDRGDQADLRCCLAECRKRDDRLLNARRSGKAGRIDMKQIGSKKAGDLLRLSLFCKCYRPVYPGRRRRVVRCCNHAAGTGKRFQAAGAIECHSRFLLNGCDVVKLVRQGHPAAQASVGTASISVRV
ncbi:hypothetical protein D3C80_700110 [compost metagenome]